MLSVAAVAIRALPPSRRSRRELLLAILWSPPVRGSGHSRLPPDAAEADMAHAAVHHLRVAGRRAVAPAVGWRAEEGAALHHLPRNADGGLSGVEGAAECWAARVLRRAAGLVRVGLVPRRVPVGRPLPDIARHVIETVAIGREGADRCRTLEA